MTWNRDYFEKSDEGAFSFFVIFGEFTDELSISASKYNFTEVPEGTDMVKYHDGAGAEHRDGFKTGYLWNELVDLDPELASIISDAPSCMVIRTESHDQSSLDYLRNVIGLATYFLDNGGISIYKPQRIKWWSPQEWREEIFEPKTPQIYSHTTILVSQQDDGLNWYHTRGMSLFARPDLSIHDVAPDQSENVIEMINRFISYQARGGQIEDGKSVNMKGLPETMWCEHKGSHDDPDFNNKHVEIHWK